MGAPKGTQLTAAKPTAAAMTETDNGDITNPLRKLYRQYRQQAAWTLLLGHEKASNYYQNAADRVMLLIADDEPAFAQ